MQPSHIPNTNLHVPSMTHRLQFDHYGGGPINYPPPSTPSSMQNGPPPPPPQFQHNQSQLYSPMQMNNYPPPDVFNASYPPPSAHALHFQQVSPVTVPTDFNISATYSINPR
ncbi:hypothetical protein Bhyg_16492, partial [Pseudolycoriella hygida]